MGGGDTDIPTASDRAAGEQAAPEKGTLLGRYVVLGPLGEGGMGVVVAAYDPELDRKVAVKLLSPAADAAGGSQGQARLLREAQAMARLNHPNVVAIHDVGTYRDHVFLAMELVEGETLRDWLKREPRRPGEVLRRFVDAGRGLAAAHDAGLVHRDFKPANVLVGKDGRVRVTDFGIARAAGTPEEPAAAASPRPISGSFATPITVAGEVLGTPGFMAPEQLAGGEVDARTDQFSFCVALHEALAGVRPFAGQDELALLASIRAGTPELPARVKVPARVRHALARGLAYDPKARWPSLAPLLSALDVEPGANRRRLLAAGAIALAVAGAVAITWRAREHRLRLCEDDPEAPALGWDEAGREAARAAFARTKTDFAADAFERSARVLDGAAHAVAASRRAACLLTRVEGKQGEEQLLAQLACLERRRGALSAAAALFANADAEVVTKAVEVAKGVGDPAGCLDARALRLEPPPPPRDASPAATAAVRAAVARAGALFDAGKPAEGAAVAREAITRARELHYGAMEAEAYLRLASNLYWSNDLTGAREAAEAAVRAGQASGNDRVTIDGAGLAATVLAVSERRFAEARRFVDLAEATVERIGSDDALAARQEKVRAILANASGDFAEGRKHSIAAYQAFVRLYGEDDPRSITALSNLAGGETDHRRSLEMRQRAIASGTRALGEHHPMVTWLRCVEAQNLVLLARYREAADEATAVLAMAKGDQANQRVDEYDCASALTNSLRKLGDLPGARKAAERMLAAAERTGGKESTYRVMAEAAMAEVELASGQPREALARFTQCRAWLESKNAASSEAASFIEGQGRALRALHQPAKAVPLFEEALRRVDGLGYRDVDLADTRFELAQALWESGKDRARARSLAQAARDTAAAEASGRELAGEIDAWLGAR